MNFPELLVVLVSFLCILLNDCEGKRKINGYIYFKINGIWIKDDIIATWLLI